MTPRILALVGTAAILGTVLTACTVDGDAAARDEAQQLVTRAGASIAEPGARPRDADYLAAQLLAVDLSPSIPDGEHDYLGVFDWRGNSGDQNGARINVRINVQMDPTEARNIGQGSRTAGSATRCWRLTVFAPRHYDNLHSEEIDCPGTADRIPHPTPIPSLPADAVARIQSVLTTATGETLKSSMTTAFPEPGVRVDTVARNGELVAAVGVPSERECIVGVRHADGTLQVSGPPGSQLEAGETGCTVELYFSPTLGH